MIQFGELWKTVLQCDRHSTIKTEQRIKKIRK